jgi:hypothetical protein
MSGHTRMQALRAKRIREGYPESEERAQERRENLLAMALAVAVRPASIARSVSVKAGLPTWRCRTRSCCRRARISMSLSRALISSRRRNAAAPREPPLAGSCARFRLRPPLDHGCGQLFFPRS